MSFVIQKRPFDLKAKALTQRRGGTEVFEIYFSSFPHAFSGNPAAYGD